MVELVGQSSKTAMVVHSNLGIATLHPCEDILLQTLMFGSNLYEQNALS